MGKIKGVPFKLLHINLPSHPTRFHIIVHISPHQHHLNELREQNRPSRQHRTQPARVHIQFTPTTAPEQKSQETRHTHRKHKVRRERLDLSLLFVKPTHHIHSRTTKQNQLRIDRYRLHVMRSTPHHVDPPTTTQTRMNTLRSIQPSFLPTRRRTDPTHSHTHDANHFCLSRQTHPSYHPVNSLTV